MKSLGTRVSEKNYHQMAKLAEEEGVTLGHYLRQVVEFFCQHQLDLKQSVYQGNDHFCRLVEEIHTAIPHLMLYSRATFAGVTQGLDEATFKQIMATTLEKTTEICGGFQAAKYQVTSVAYNPNRFKTIPINPNQSVWR